MTDKIKRGILGERLAAEFLERKGYRVVARNYRYRRAEIDLIVKKENWLVFVEVKTRSSQVFGYPEEFVDDKKAERILDGADQYLYETGWKGSVRYDIVAVNLGEGDPEIVHFEDAIH